MSMKIKYEKSLANIYPDIALEWHPTRNGELTPYGVSAKSGKKVWWHCSEGHEWEALISNRTRNRSLCPYCKGKKAYESKVGNCRYLPYNV